MKHLPEGGIIFSSSVDVGAFLEQQSDTLGPLTCMRLSQVIFYRPSLIVEYLTYFRGVFVLYSGDQIVVRTADSDASDKSSDSWDVWP